METLQQFITPLTHAWQHTDSIELVSFAICFAALWLLAMVIETAVKKVIKED